MIIKHGMNTTEAATLRKIEEWRNDFRVIADSDAFMSGGLVSKSSLAFLVGKDAVEELLLPEVRPQHIGYIDL